MQYSSVHVTAHRLQGLHFQMPPPHERAELCRHRLSSKPALPCLRHRGVF
jgi:hypothetical protein